MTISFPMSFLIACCFGVLHFGSHIHGDEIKPEPTPLSSPDVSRSPVTQKPLINFEHLGETRPDENYLPVFPELLQNLKDKEVSMLGFMVPYDDLEDLGTFMLMEIYVGCNFCPPPPLDQVVLVRQKPPKPPLTHHEYVDGPIEVTGKLGLWSKDSQEPVFVSKSFLFVLDDAVLSPVPNERFSPEQPEHRIKH